VPHQMPEYLRDRLGNGLQDPGRARGRTGGGEGHRGLVAVRLDPVQDDQGVGAASINAITHMSWSRPGVRSRAYPGIVETSWKVRDLCMMMACSVGVPACSTWC
jgi:hypothetical protein